MVTTPRDMVHRVTPASYQARRRGGGGEEEGGSRTTLHSHDKSRAGPSLHERTLRLTCRQSQSVSPPPAGGESALTVQLPLTSPLISPTARYYLYLHHQGWVLNCVHSPEKALSAEHLLRNSGPADNAKGAVYPVSFVKHALPPGAQRPLRRHISNINLEGEVTSCQVAPTSKQCRVSRGTEHVC